MRRDLPPVHPGEHPCEAFMRPLGLAVSRLARYFRTAPEFWLAMQRDYKLET